MDETKIERIGQEVGRLDLADHILAWDKKQGHNSAEARFCKTDRNHGRLQMSGSGVALVCCTMRPQPCGYQEPVSR